jgi:hypothetical protein
MGCLLPEDKKQGAHRPIAVMRHYDETFRGWLFAP